MTSKNKQYFSLIDENSLQPAPGEKIIPQEIFTKLLSAEELLEKVQQDGEEYRKKVVLECETLKAEAMAEGFDEGFQKWIAKIATLEEEIERVRNEVKGLVIPLALKAAKKIVGREMELSEDVISTIVSATLSSVAQSKQIKLYVHKSNRPLLEQKREEFKTLFEKLETFSVQVRDDVDEGGFIIETDQGVINGTLKHRWDALERAFGTLQAGQKQALEQEPSH